MALANNSSSPNSLLIPSAAVVWAAQPRLRSLERAQPPQLLPVVSLASSNNLNNSNSSNQAEDCLEASRTRPTLVHSSVEAELAHSVKPVSNLNLNRAAVCSPLASLRQAQVARAAASSATPIQTTNSQQQAGLYSAEAAAGSEVVLGKTSRTNRAARTQDRSLVADLSLAANPTPRPASRLARREAVASLAARSARAKTKEACWDNRSNRTNKRPISMQHHMAPVHCSHRFNPSHRTTRLSLLKPPQTTKPSSLGRPCLVLECRTRQSRSTKSLAFAS